MQVFPNVFSDDSGFGAEDYSDYSKEELGMQKKAQRWKGADEHGEYEVQKVVDHRFDKVIRPQPANLWKYKLPWRLQIFNKYHFIFRMVQTSFLSNGLAGEANPTPGNH